MFKKQDPNSFSHFCTLLIESKTNIESDNELVSEENAVAIGTFLSEYLVTRYHDLQLQNASAVAKTRSRQFLLHCTQRVTLYNKNGLNVSPNAELFSYDNYPVMMNAQILISQGKGLNFRLLQYSPQTVNTKIQSSGSEGSEFGKTLGSSRTSTVGSSTAETNSFGVSVSVGINDLMPTASVSGNYENSNTVSNENSRSAENSNSVSGGSNSSTSESMSIKDWGSYALVNPYTKCPVWTFGQEYPWDVIECRATNNNRNPNNPEQTDIVLPTGMLVRLYDQVSLYPPSQLSMFGINFVMKALWLITLDDDASETLDIEHFVNYYTASHMIPVNEDGEKEEGEEVNARVYLDRQPAILRFKENEGLNISLDLPLMSLDCMDSNSAIIGFIPNKFTVEPNIAPIRAFKITATTNNLLIRDTTRYPDHTDGAGFTSSEVALSAGFSNVCKELEMTLYFKIADTINDYKLFMKHWKTGITPIQLTFIINGDEKNSSIVKFVDALEAEGGENNLLSLSLRNLNFASIDYHDYLQLGLNSVQIKIAPMGVPFIPDSGYQIRAISIEKD